MAKEIKYREWRKSKNKQSKRRRQGRINPILWFSLGFLFVTFIITNNSDWLSFFPIQNNALKSLTREFVTEIDEPVFYSSGDNLQKNNFYPIDQLAKKVDYDGNSTTQLANLLSSHANSEVEKARIIYTWITHNITYDVAALDNLFNQNIYPDVTTKAVLKNKATICSGYANLYQQLAEKMGLKSVIVLGYAKGGDYIVGNDNRVNHAWNAVQINNNWYLIDATWGAGTVIDDIFKAKFNPFYFATIPQEFIYTHFPEKSKWQLLSARYTRSQFDNLPTVSSDLFKNKIKLISHQSEKISVDNRLTLTLEAPKNIVAAAALRRPSENNNVKAKKRSFITNYTLVQRQGKNIIVKVAFPEKGKYQLDIFAKPEDGNNSYPLIVTYDIVAKRSSGEMPKIFANFYEHNAYLESPLEGDLTSNQNVYFKIKIDNVTDVQVLSKSTNKRQKLTRYGNVFAGNISVISGKMIVFAKFNHDDSRYWALLEYK